jgi:hypothetical protein
MPDWNGEAWCSLHWCHPTECWGSHNPSGTKVKGSQTKEEREQITANLHLIKQNGSTKKWLKKYRKRMLKAKVKGNGHLV